jgi:hypothetical protein
MKAGPAGWMTRALVGGWDKPLLGMSKKLDNFVHNALSSIPTIFIELPCPHLFTAHARHRPHLPPA